VPALAGDEDRHVLGGDAADGLVHVLHRRTAADNRVGPVVHRLIGRDDGGNVHQPADGDGAIDDLRSWLNSSGLSKYS